MVLPAMRSVVRRRRPRRLREENGSSELSSICDCPAEYDVEIQRDGTSRATGDASTMIYALAALVPPLGLLFNGQPFSAILNVLLIVFCLIFGIFFHILLLVPSAHALIAVHMKREDRRHREVVDAIRRYGPPPGYPR
jgi:hypothetical protein